MDEGKSSGFPESEAVHQNHFAAIAETMLEELKLLADKRDVPYQSLAKIFLSERIDAELRRYEPKKIKG